MIEASKKEIDLTSEINYPDPGKIRFNLLEGLNQPPQSRTSVRERLRDLGAAKGMLLDRPLSRLEGSPVRRSGIS